jgi:hypothetical protein
MIIVKLIGLVVLWFLSGGLINLIFYSRPSAEFPGKSPGAQGFHWILNILTIILGIMILVGRL